MDTRTMRTLRRLIKMVSVSNVGEVEIEADARTFRLVKAQMPAMAHRAAHAVMPSPVALVAPVASGLHMPSLLPSAARHVITSPLVGRFYCGAGPASKLRAKLGAEVRVGEDLCVIEALKIATPIQSKHGGRIIEILCNNGDAVQYGQPLLVIE